MFGLADQDSSIEYRIAYIAKGLLLLGNRLA